MSDDLYTMASELLKLILTFLYSRQHALGACNGSSTRWATKMGQRVWGAVLSDGYSAAGWPFSGLEIT